MQTENAIEVKNVVKQFKVYFDKGSQLKEKILFQKRNRYEERRVLNDISFEVKKGEAIGLIGNNGCGKSTTLKLLTKIIYPDSGSIEMRGRVSSLIELGAGFHPDMSGRENIYTNAAIFGLTKKEIDARLNDIIEFSELGEYIDNPVRTYSSGMYMRLAFSVAINVDADILLIDEILAVGDANFQAKCFNRMREIKAAGTTIVLVSHSMGQIEQICDRAIWIKSGNIEEQGDSREVIQKYMAWIMGNSSEKEHVTLSDKNENVSSEQESNEQESVEKVTDEKPENKEQERYTVSDIFELRSSGKLAEIGNKEVRITKYEMLDGKTQKAKNNFALGDDLLLRIWYKRENSAIKESLMSVSIYRSDKLPCYSTNIFVDTGKMLQLKDEGVVEVIIHNMQFLQGEYSIDLGMNEDYGPVYHTVMNALRFSTFNVQTDWGVFRPNLSWNIEEDQNLN